MSCQEIATLFPTRLICRYERFLKLPKEPRLMLNDWFEITWKMRESPLEEHRRGMLMAWSLLGFIGQITTDTTSERDWVGAILINPEFEQIFNSVMSNPKSLMRMYGKRFAAVWPVFDSAELTRSGIIAGQAPVRADVIAGYIQENQTAFYPPCWPEHLAAKEALLPDWQHTLSAWYIVQKNLLDPNGWHATEMDLRIITNSFLSLVYFFKEGKVFFETPSMRPDIFDRTQIFSSL
jgi:hypothetical protein